MMQEENIYLVYNAGKVGSTTVYQHLCENFAHAFHAHYLTKEYFKENPNCDPYFISSNKLYHDFRDKNPNLRLKIITVLRDPVARDVSGTFHMIRHMLANGEVKEEELKASEILKTFAPHNSYTYNYHGQHQNWFDSEFKAFTGVDLLDQKFNKEKGYSIYNFENFDLLLIKLEKSRDILKEALESFTNEKFEEEPTDGNVTSDKFKSDIYSEFKKRYTLSNAGLSNLYDGKFIKTFYTNEEREKLKHTWSNQKLFKLEPEETLKYFPPTENHIQYNGRVKKSADDAILMEMAGEEILFTLKASHLSMIVKHDKGNGNRIEQHGPTYFDVFIDDIKTKTIAITSGEHRYELFNNNEAKTQTVKLKKRTDLFFGSCEIYSFVTNPEAEIIARKIPQPSVIECIGNGEFTGVGNLIAVNRSEVVYKFDSLNQDCAQTMGAIYSKQKNCFTQYVGGLKFGLNKKNKECYDYISYYKELLQHRERFFNSQKPKKILINVGTSDFEDGSTPKDLQGKYEELISILQELWGDVEIIHLIGPKICNSYPANETRKTAMGNMILDVIENFEQKGMTKMAVYELNSQTGEFGFGESWHPTVAQHQRGAEEITLLEKYQLAELEN